jgi:hypothetical protein
MLVLFAALLWIDYNGSSNYSPPLYPLCDYPRRWQNITLPSCDPDQNAITVYEPDGDELVRYYFTSTCQNYSKWIYKKEVLIRDECLDQYNGVSLVHVWNNLLPFLTPKKTAPGITSSLF